MSLACNIPPAILVSKVHILQICVGLSENINIVTHTLDVWPGLDIQSDFAVSIQCTFGVIGFSRFMKI